MNIVSISKNKQRGVSNHIETPRRNCLSEDVYFPGFLLRKLQAYVYQL
jgi:hypothetical protein